MASSVSLLTDPVGRNLLRAMSQRTLLGKSGALLVEWAGQALIAGWDSPPLRVLAGLESPINEFDVDMYLSRTLAALGSEVPGREALASAYSYLVASDILDGRCAIMAGCLELSTLCIKTDYPQTLWPFYEAMDFYALAEDGFCFHGSVESVVQSVRDQAQRLVDSPPRL